MSAEETLEAAIWQAIRGRRVTTDEPAQFVDDVLAAALAYAAGAGDSPALAAVRRTVAARDGWPKP